YRMQSLGQTCIFCASNPKGQTTFFASYVVSGKVLPSGSKFFISFSTPRIPCQTNHLMPSIAIIPMWYPTSFGLVCNQGTTMFCSPPTYASDLSIPFLFRNLPQLRTAFDQDHLLQCILQYLLQAHPLQCP